MLNRYPAWKYVLIGLMILLGVIYAVPNLYGEDPSIQISAKAGASVGPAVTTQVENSLETNKLSYLSMGIQSKDSLLVRFSDTDNQLKARDFIKDALGDNYIVALNLAPKTPHWLASLGANPMKLGLDLRGGVHFLLAVDVQSIVEARQQGDVRNFGNALRGADLRYTQILTVKPNGLLVSFKNPSDVAKAVDLLSTSYPDYLFKARGSSQLLASFKAVALTKIDRYAVDQTMSILRNRINELGVSEPIVQQQGKDQVSVDLPGIQDTARAKDLLGKTATLKFQLVDDVNDPQAAVSGSVPYGSSLYYYQGRPYLLKNQVILSGDSITDASSGFGENGRPNVNISLGGGGEELFANETADNIGKGLAVVYVETKLDRQMVNGKPVMTRTKQEKVINVATIQSALGGSFQITGLESVDYAQNLALLLRSGALAAPVDIISERTIGPSLGKANIEKGVLSLEIGSIAVILFMALYYGVFGLIADMALLLNIVLILAILSILGATLTLSGIAGIVLTVGMAVDANVLIYERIREELRNGNSVQASIATGYSRAFMTIVDSNVTTLIVALVLFAIGSSSVKGFAITLTIGIVASMITSIFFTRAIVNWWFGGKSMKQLPIGIKVKSTKQVVK